MTKSESLKIPIKGMHCKSCTIIVTDELEKIPGVQNASVSLKDNEATIKFNKKPSEAQIERAIEAAGYTIGIEKKPFFSRDKAVYIQLAHSLALIVVFLLFIKRLGFGEISFNNLSGNKPLLALVLGLTAGVSTCMALVGGLVLGLSSRFAEKHKLATPLQKFRPHLFFNLGRIVTFFVLGGLLGVSGGFIKLDSGVTGLLTVFIGFVMIILGLQLTEIFPRLANKGITLPAGIAKALGLKNYKEKEYSHANAVIMGGLSFFLPCGFTQSMQLVAIASGNFWTGAIVMGLFAIGTAPGLLGVGGLTSVVKGEFAKIFFRFVGVLVVILAIYNITNGFNLMGYKFSFNLGSGGSSNSSSTIDPNAIVLKTKFKGPDAGSDDITPSKFNVQVGKSYVLELEAEEDGQGCMSTIMIPGLYNTPILITKGTVRLPFTVSQAGTYQITCAMGIVRGTITATDGGK